MVRHRQLHSICQERIQSWSLTLLFICTHPHHCSKQRADVSGDSLQEQMSNNNFFPINFIPAFKTEHLPIVLRVTQQSTRKCEFKILLQGHTYDFIQIMRYRNFHKMYG